MSKRKRAIPGGWKWRHSWLTLELTYAQAVAVWEVISNEPAPRPELRRVEAMFRAAIAKSRETPPDGDPRESAP